ncbi:MAG: Lrp/AsnC family transcriptional regulator [Acidimicrobiales bacterium]
MVHAFVLIEAEPARVADLAAELVETPGVTEVYSVAGQLADLVAIVRVRRHDDLADVVTGGIGRLTGIVSTSTMVAFQAFSKHDLESMWDVGPR